MTLAAIDQCAVVSVTFAEIELAADNLVARFNIAVNFDALNVEALALPDHIDEVDKPAIGPALTARERRWRKARRSWPVQSSRASTVPVTASAS